MKLSAIHFLHFTFFFFFLVLLFCKCLTEVAMKIVDFLVCLLLLAMHMRVAHCNGAGRAQRSGSTASAASAAEAQPLATSDSAGGRSGAAAAAAARSVRPLYARRGHRGGHKQSGDKQKLMMDSAIKLFVCI